MKAKRLSSGKPWERYDFFPAPPWATQSLFEHVVPVISGSPLVSGTVISEPAAGLGHMSDVLAEYSGDVFASDIYDYPVDERGSKPPIMVADFLSDAWPGPESDWIITNPPFGSPDRFIENALKRARRGGAFLHRMQWLEGQTRYSGIYLRHPPSVVAPFVERLAMCEGGWDSLCSSATMYAWFVWVKDTAGHWARPLRHGTTLPTLLIPPGRRIALTAPSDVRFAKHCVPGFNAPSSRKRKVSKPFDWDAAHWLPRRPAASGIDRFEEVIGAPREMEVSAC